MTKCQRSTESADAQPTHEPVAFWSPTSHHVSRRSLAFGTAAAASNVPASTAVSAAQSRSAFGEGMTFSTRRPRTAVLKGFSLTARL